MRLVKSIEELREALSAERAAGKSIGYVPTMGYFHDGHLALMHEARRQAGVVVVSIFVNPLQFGPSEDLQTYPRDIERDEALAEKVGVDYLFVPADEEMYPKDFLTRVRVEKITDVMCGSFRPGHFTGVTTVVTKLFNIVQPEVAFFGCKDYQQLKVIERMVDDLNFPIRIHSVPTVREPDGLAMSSRNARLSPAERAAALSLHRALERIARLIEDGERRVSRLLQEGRSIVESQPLVDLEYLTVRDAESLAEIEHIDVDVVVAIAARMGTVRLIDNEIVRLPFALSPSSDKIL